MKRLLRYLSPFAPDQSGAAAALFEFGGILVICDAGGCAGNVCGFDEPRWYSQKSAVFSAGLRDIDAILGRDERLVEKTVEAAKEFSANFIAFIGTPVPAVTASDLHAVSRMTEKRTGIPSFAVETTGMETYEKGAAKALLALLDLLENRKKDAAEIDQDRKGAVRRMKGEIGIWGATPLDLPAADSGAEIRRRCRERYDARAVCFGLESGWDQLKQAFSVRENLVVSIPGLEVAKFMRKQYGIPYKIGFPLPDFQNTGTVRKKRFSRGLILHQQILGNSLRDSLVRNGLLKEGDVCSFFSMDHELMQRSDRFLPDEESFIRTAEGGGYDVILGDPMFKRAVGRWSGVFVPLPHYAVSGQMYAEEKETEFWENMLAKLEECGGEDQRWKENASEK